MVGFVAISSFLFFAMPQALQVIAAEDCPSGPIGPDEDFDLWVAKFSSKPTNFQRLTSYFYSPWSEESNLIRELHKVAQVIPTELPLFAFETLDFGVQEGYIQLKSRKCHHQEIVDWFEQHMSTTVLWYQEQHKKARHKRIPSDVPVPTGYQDPKIPVQWHLWDSVSSSRSSLEPWTAWDRNVTGENVHVAVVDDGCDITHGDLKDAYDPLTSYDLIDSQPILPPTNMRNNHGTRCAGQIAARRNDNYGIGIAYNCRLSCIRLISDQTHDALEAKALTFKYQDNDIYSLSWGPPDDGRALDGPGHLTATALKDGVTNGRDGKGNIYVMASGNGGPFDDACGADGYANSIYTITVASVDESNQWPIFGERCSSQLLVTSYGGNASFGVQTTDIFSEWTSGHYGTSAAAPFVSASVALLLNYRPELSWRDVQNILARSAVPINQNREVWHVNGAGMAFSERYGFGVVKIDKMLTFAGNYTMLPKSSKQVTIVDITDSGNVNFGGRNFTIPVEKSKIPNSKASPAILEHVELLVSIESQSRRDIQIALTSPNGTKTMMFHSRRNDRSNEGLDKWVLSSVQHWGEVSWGDWIVTIDNSGTSAAKVNHMQLTLYGSPCTLEERILLPNLPAQCPWELTAHTQNLARALGIAFTVSILALVFFGLLFYYRKRNIDIAKSTGNQLGSTFGFRPLPRSQSLESNRFSSMIRSSSSIQLTDMASTSMYDLNQQDAPEPSSRDRVLQLQRESGRAASPLSIRTLSVKSNLDQLASPGVGLNPLQSPVNEWPRGSTQNLVSSNFDRAATPPPLSTSATRNAKPKATNRTDRSD